MWLKSASARAHHDFRSSGGLHRSVSIGSYTQRFYCLDYSFRDLFGDIGVKSLYYFVKKSIPLYIAILLLFITGCAIYVITIGIKPTLTVTRTVTPIASSIQIVSITIPFDRVVIKRDYVSTVMKLIEHANSSVYVAMFLIKYDPRDPVDPVNELLDRLCSVYRRGVEVRVLVDDKTYSVYPQTIEYLKSCGIKIKIWSFREDLHAKILIIDRKYVVIGSHNWTESGLWWNIEVSIISSNPDTVEKIVKLFEDLWRKAVEV